MIKIVGVRIVTPASVGGTLSKRSSGERKHNQAKFAMPSNYVSADVAVEFAVRIMD